MIKILHSADWHLDAPMSGHSQEVTDYLRKGSRKLPQKLLQLCRAEQCDLLLLSGDLFDGQPSGETVRSVQQTLEQVHIPVFIAPGNHDPYGANSPYTLPGWPENVHIFTRQQITSVSLPELDCRIYGAAYQSMDCPGLLKDFQVSGKETWHIGVLHGEADTGTSAYCPITKAELLSSGLSYLALGHIHKSGSLRAGDTLCAWPGCPMGRGFDELGTKGVILITADTTLTAAFLPLDTPRFYDEEVEATDDPREAVAAVLPALPTEDFYRITLTGYSTGVSLPELSGAFPHVPHLTLRDETRPEADLWSTVDADTLEGVYFSMLQQAAQSDSPALAARAKLAARISRQILDGQEVKLP